MNPFHHIKQSRILPFASLFILIGVAALAYALFSGPPASRGESKAARAPVLSASATGENALAKADINGDGTVYQDPMHPWILRDAPGKAPDCGMDLVPVSVNGAQSEEGIVSIDPAVVQNIGVRTAPVTVEALGQSVRTTGRFEANEQLQTAVSPKIGGWVERLHVNYEGARVRRGQPLLEIYSPELVSTQEEYLIAIRSARRVAGTAAEADAQRLVGAARRRLAFWDISEAQIKRLEESGQPQKTLTLYAPASGTVVKKDVVQGQQVMPGMTLMELADLSRIWLMVDVQEQDLAWVQRGTSARIELPSEPGAEYSGRVDYLYDELNPETRTLQARVTLPNPGLRFKPGMYATVSLTGGGTASAPVVPGEAVLRSGDRNLVILALGGGRFRPVEVQVGTETGGRVQILQGLAGGEEVVTSAQFLIDSESRLKSAIGAMGAGHNHGGSAAPPESSPAPSGQAAPSHEGHATPASPRSESTRVVKISVGATGFSPARFDLKAGEPVHLVFTRTAGASCADKIRIPGLSAGVTALPVDKPVTVTVTPGKSGSFTFACAMDMLKGTIVVKA